MFEKKNAHVIFADSNENHIVTEGWASCDALKERYSEADRCSLTIKIIINIVRAKKMTSFLAFERNANL